VSRVPGRSEDTRRGTGWRGGLDIMSLVLPPTPDTRPLTPISFGRWFFARVEWLQAWRVFLFPNPERVNPISWRQGHAPVVLHPVAPVSGSPVLRFTDAPFPPSSLAPFPFLGPSPRSQWREPWMNRTPVLGRGSAVFFLGSDPIVSRDGAPPHDVAGLMPLGQVALK